jgi:hypothetical protein
MAVPYALAAITRTSAGLLDASQRREQDELDENLVSATELTDAVPEPFSSHVGNIIAECREMLRNVADLPREKISEAVAEIDTKLDLADLYFEYCRKIDPNQRSLYVRPVRSLRGKEEQQKAIDFVLELYRSNGGEPVPLKAISEYLGKKTVGAVRMLLGEPLQDGRLLRADGATGGVIPSLGLTEEHKPKTE